VSGSGTRGVTLGVRLGLALRVGVALALGVVATLPSVKTPHQALPLETVGLEHLPLSLAQP
jgi:hypothetical protein